MKSVTCNTLKEINRLAFSECTSLEWIIAEKVHKVNEGRFFKCEKLRNIKFSENVVFEPYSFYGCDMLENHHTATKLTIYDLYDFYVSGSSSRPLLHFSIICPAIHSTKSLNFHNSGFFLLLIPSISLKFDLAKWIV